ncbi:hypothetical protein D3C85_1517860 [compost metagenome]
MPSRSSDAGIPTLTHRAEPSLYEPAGDDADAPLLTELADDADSASDDPFPLLTDVADEAGPAQSAPVPELAASLPDPTVLAARLQAEVEQLMRVALADAIEQIQARMDSELPAIVSRVLNGVRPG